MEPTEAAKRKACELAQKHVHDHPNFYKSKMVEPYNPTLYALALYIDETQAFRQEVSDAVEKFTKIYVNCREPCDLDRFIIPRPDPDEALARDVALARWPSGGGHDFHNAEGAAFAGIKAKEAALRKAGRITDAQ